jgi:hypothetical protein
MKRLLLIVMLSSLSFVGSAQQIVLNELYTRPSSGRHEFFELYNNSFTQLNVNGVTIVTYYRNSATDEGLYILDLPSGSVAPSKYYVGGSAATILYQTQTKTADCNWNALGTDDSPTNSTGGYLKKFKKNGTGYTDVSADLTPGLNDFFMNAGGSVSANYSVFVYSNGILVNSFFGGTNSISIPAELRALPSKTVPVIGGTVASFNLDFSTTAIVDNKGEFVRSVDGTDNGYIREGDGFCGSWVKSSAQKNHNPGVSNGTTTTTATLTITTPTCVAFTAANIVRVGYSITGGPVEAFPVEVILVDDLGVSDANGTTDLVDQTKLPDLVLNESDFAVTGSTTFNAVGNSSRDLSPWTTAGAYLSGYTGQKSSRAFHVAFKTVQGCFDRIAYAAPQNASTLPVSFKSFTAKRNKQNVVLSWQTATELNNAGFAIERNVNGNWTEIAFVPSQANGGNSSTELNYTYNDLNSYKGISQYRIRQNDLDAKTSYSVIRSVQGEGAGPKLVIYPNPSMDGRVQLVFEDANSARHIVISDMNGRIVRQVSNVLNSSLSIDGLNVGLYTARVINQATGESTLQKFVIQQK